MTIFLRAAGALSLTCCLIGCEQSGGDDETPDVAAADTAVDGGDLGGTGDVPADGAPSDAGEAAMSDTTFRLGGVTLIRPAGVGPILENLINNDIGC